MQLILCNIFRENQVFILLVVTKTSKKWSLKNDVWLSSTQWCKFILKSISHFIQLNRGSCIIKNFLLRLENYVMFCAIWYHLYNFKNSKNIEGGELLFIGIYIYIYIKVGLLPSLKVAFIFLNESSLKMMRNAFYFMFKVLFVLKIYTFFT